MNPDLLHFFNTSQNFQTKPDFTSGKRNVPIDVLRGASMLYIVGFWHLLYYPVGMEWHDNPVTYRLMILVLAIFAMISGYTIGNKRPELKPAIICKFYADRFWRLYPPLVLAAALYLVLRIASPVLLAKDLTLTGMFFLPPPPTLWFVDMIAVYYLLAPFLINLRSNIALFALFCGLVLIFMLTYYKVTHRMDHRLFIYFPSFAIGLFLSQRRIPSSLLSDGTLLALAVASLFPTLERPQLDQSFWATPWALAGSLFIFVTVLNVGKQWRERKVIFNLSTASYFMYLLHRPVYTIGMWLLPPNKPVLESIFLVAVCLPLTGFISWNCQVGYDKFLSKRAFAHKRRAI